ncbi:unnamed protein product [Mortierella alpina]
MLIFEDVISGDKLFSDAFPIKEVGVFYEIDCAMITIKKGVDVDIGANVSAEDAADDYEDGTEITNNVVHSFSLSSTSFDKKSYLTHAKQYVKSLKPHIRLEGDAIKAYEVETAAAFRKIAEAFNVYEFFVGNTMNPDGAVMLLNYREDGVTPYFTVFKYGVKAREV